MQRQLFETSKDLLNESDFAKKIAERRKVILYKLPISYRLDFLVADSSDRAVGFAEIKCRNNASTEYPTFAISLAKYESGLRLTEHLCHDLNKEPVIFLIFVRWSDKDMYYKHKAINADKIYCRWGGRIWDARDRDDREPMVHIPVTLFREI